MVQINFARREIGCKIVYYGPGLSGKTTNLELIHKKVPDMSKGQMTSIATEGDRTLFFDLLPLDLGEVAGMKTKLQLYTVPGQIYYNSTRKLVLQGADGVVFVADSGKDRMADNKESFDNLLVNLKEYGLDPSALPLVLQYNKRDLPNPVAVEELNSSLNTFNAPYFEAVAVKGEGVMPTLKAISKLVIEKLNKDLPQKSTPTPIARPAVAREEVVVAAPAAAVPAGMVASTASSSRESAVAHTPPPQRPFSMPVRESAPPPPPPRVEAPRPPLARPSTPYREEPAPKSKAVLIGVIVAAVAIAAAILYFAVLK